MSLAIETGLSVGHLNNEVSRAKSRPARKAAAERAKARNARGGRR